MPRDWHSSITRLFTFVHSARVLSHGTDVSNDSATTPYSRPRSLNGNEDNRFRLVNFTYLLWLLRSLRFMVLQLFWVDVSFASIRITCTSRNYLSLNCLLIVSTEYNTDATGENIWMALPMIYK